MGSSGTGRPRLPWREGLLALASIVAVAGAFELFGQIYAAQHPSFDVLYLEPDRVVGWKEVPGLSWQWAGHSWYASEFSVSIHANSLGFRDKERDPTKVQGVQRVAVLGDSYVEALQVPLEKTATQLLEARLNDSLGKAAGRRFEVLNFGISGYGLGQELLTFQEYARRLQPDYVVVFCAGYYTWRTIDKKAGGGFPGTKESRLSIRPTFHLEGDRLIPEPAEDYDAFIEKQRFVMRTVFGGSRMARRGRKCFLLSYLEESRRTRGHWLGSLLWGRPRPTLKIFRDPTPDVLALNLRILEELADEANEVGCRMVLVDLSTYFNATSSLPKALKRFCNNRRVGYLPLSEELLAAERRGQRVQLPVDTHFTDLGNRITADTLYTWLESHGALAP
jgi:hypothetical protein